jgi:hypothetical protein
MRLATSRQIEVETADAYIAKFYDKTITLPELAKAVTLKWFRLNCFYFIKDKNGKRVKFRPNQEQRRYYANGHHRDVILKARQLGFTTLKMVSSLDSCLFHKDFSAGVICHSLDDARDIFRNKIKYAYQQMKRADINAIFKAIDRAGLSRSLYQLPKAKTDQAGSYVFDNGSSIRVSTSYRGGTLQDLHVSEFGKICRKYPEKAEEIATGAYEAVGIDGSITLESTAEGREGRFYDTCKDAQHLANLGREPSRLEFKFHFFAWWENQDYSTDESIDIPDRLTTYFDQLEAKGGIKLTDGQRRWYAAKEKTLQEKMKREYPSTPEEAFEQSIEGAYYANQFRKIYAERRIIDFAINDAPVHTAWDLGVGDSTAIWFYQRIGKELHIIDHYENSGEGLEHYFGVLDKRGYNYGEHYAPHDIQHRELGSGGRSRKDLAAEGFEVDGKRLKIHFRVVPVKRVDDGIEDVRRCLDRCYFKESTTVDGVKCLESYRKEWNDKLGCFRDKPLHDWSSHSADAFRYLATVEDGTRAPAAAVPFGRG